MPALLKIIVQQAITNAQGSLLSTGTITFVATDDQDNEIPFRIPFYEGALGHQAIPTLNLRTITNGSMDGGDLYLANPIATAPSDILYRITVTDLQSGLVIPFRRVQIVDAGDGTWNFATWNTGLSLSRIPITVVSGPAGATGAPGPAGPAGASGTATQTSSTGGFFVRGDLVLGDIASLAKATMDSCLAANHNVIDGLDLFYAGPPYSGIYASDFGLTADAYPSAVTVAQLLTVVDQIIAYKDSSGRFPSAVGITGTTLFASFYSPWDTPRHFPVGDAFFFLPLIEYLAWQKSNDTTHFVLNAAAYEACMATLPRDSATGLVFVDPSAPWIPWAFQEIVGITGLVCLGSMLYYRAATQLAALYTSAGRNTDAARWSGNAATVKASLQASSQLWDAANGMYRAATVDCYNNIDHYGSAMAVAFGVASPAQQTAISNYFVNHYPAITLNGVCFQTANVAGGYDWDRFGQLGTDNVRHAQTFYGGQYQNGRWSVANGWICKAIALTEPALALQYATDQVVSSYPMQEWFNADGSPQGGTANLESPMGAGGYILSLGAAKVAPFLGIGTNAQVMNGRTVIDGSSQAKIMSQGPVGARLAIESPIAAELHLTCTGMGDIALVMSNTGNFTASYAPYGSVIYTPFLSFGPGGIGETMLTVTTVNAATQTVTDGTATRQVVGLGGWSGTQSPGGQLALNSGTNASSKLKFLYANNKNFAWDAYPVSSLGIPTPVLRLIHDADETDAAVIVEIDTTGDVAFAGTVGAKAFILAGVNSDGTPDGHLYKISVVAGVLTTTAIS